MYIYIKRYFIHDTQKRDYTTCTHTSLVIGLDTQARACEKVNFISNAPFSHGYIYIGGASVFRAPRFAGKRDALGPIGLERRVPTNYIDIRKSLCINVYGQPYNDTRVEGGGGRTSNKFVRFFNILYIQSMF